MMKLSRTRTLLELRVGENAAVDVVLYVRRQDLQWFNNNNNPKEAMHHKDNNNNNNSNNETDEFAAVESNKNDDTTSTMNRHQHDDRSDELFALLGQSVLPRMFPREIPAFHYRRHPHRKPPPLGPGGIPILAGERGTSSAKQQGGIYSGNNNVNTKPTNKKGAKRKRGATTTTGKAKTAKQKAEALLGLGDDDDGDDDPSNTTARANKQPPKEVYYAFGQTLQLAYRCEEVVKGHAASFAFCSDNDNGDDDDSNNNNSSKNNEGLLRELDKLPKRIVAWCFPYNPSQPSEPDPTNGGFLLPERIPIAQLFRGGI